MSQGIRAELQLLAFRLDGQRYALPFASIERVVPAVALTPLPGAPATIRGVFSLHGAIVPVGDLRRRLGLAEREIALEDQIVVARSPTRVLGVLTEGASEVLECAEEDIVGTGEMVEAAGTVTGIARLESGLILIHDLARFLSLGEERALDEAMGQEAAHAT